MGGHRSLLGKLAARGGLAAGLAACALFLGAFLVGVTPVAIMATSGSRATGAPGWHESSFFDGPLAAVSCASASHCVAVGGSGFAGSVPVLVTFDGGSTWSAGSLPSSVGSLASVSCPTASLCVAAGATAKSTSLESVAQGGLPFSAPRQQLLLSSTDGGMTWSLDSVTPALDSSAFTGAVISDVSCASASFCMAVGSYYASNGAGEEALVLVSTDGGSDWSRTPEPSMIASFTSLSCPAPGNCFATGTLPRGELFSTTFGIFSTTTGGAAWSVQAESGSPETVACSSSSNCVAVGATVSATTDGGATWTRVGSGPGTSSGYLPFGQGANPLSCPSVSFCVAATPGGLAVTTDGGNSWTLPALAPQVSTVTSVSCASTSACMAVGAAGAGAAILSSTDGGSTWNFQDGSATTYGLSGASCANASDCMVVGGSTVEGTSDGGVTWNEVALPSGQGAGDVYLSAVSCGTASSCVAVGGSEPSPLVPGAAAVIDVGSPTGSGMQSVAVPGDAATLSAVSCVGTPTCVALGQSLEGGPVVLVSSSGGQSWSSSVILPGGVSKLVSVSCTSAEDCLLVAEGVPASEDYYHGTPALVLVSTDGGFRWRERGVLASSGGASGKGLGLPRPTSVSCVTPEDCVVTVANGLGPGSDVPGVLYTVDGGQTWLAGSLAPGSEGLSSFLRGEEGNGTVSCAGAADCVMAEVSPEASAVLLRSTDGGATWEVETELPLGSLSPAFGGFPSFGPSPIGLSCGTEAACVLAGGLATYATTDGGVGTPSAPIDVHALGASGTAVVTWSPPLVDGGAPIGSYVVESSPAGHSATVPASATEAVISGLSDGESYTFSVQAVNSAGAGSVSSPSNVAVPSPPGYSAVDAEGGVYAFGSAVFAGSLPGEHIVPAAPIVGMATTPDGRGYWLVDQKGGVYAFGDAKFLGSLPGEKLVPFGPIVAIVATPDGGGYWLVSGAGFVYTFGDAAYAGPVVPSRYGISSIVGMAASPDGRGYWLVGSNGGVYAFGSAAFAGSLPGEHIVPAAPIVGMAASPDGRGYWLVDGKGGVYAFGDASYLGSLPGEHIVPAAPIVGMAATPDGRGYWLVDAEGGIYAFGDASYLGSLPGEHIVPAAPIVGMASRP